MLKLGKHKATAVAEYNTKLGSLLIRIRTLKNLLAKSSKDISTLSNPIEESTETKLDIHRYELAFKIRLLAIEAKKELEIMESDLEKLLADIESKQHVGKRNTANRSKRGPKAGKARKKGPVAGKTLASSSSSSVPTIDEEAADAKEVADGGKETEAAANAEEIAVEDEETETETEAVANETPPTDTPPTLSDPEEYEDPWSNPHLPPTEHRRMALQYDMECAAVAAPLAPLSPLAKTLAALTSTRRNLVHRFMGHRVPETTAPICWEDVKDLAEMLNATIIPCGGSAHRIFFQDRGEYYYASEPPRDSTSVASATPHKPHGRRSSAMDRLSLLQIRQALEGLGCARALEEAEGHLQLQQPPGHRIAAVP